ncbi:MAG: portal protein [Bacteroidales bacterium]|nr:portal protein [Bacteroidales bacterium]
MAWYNKLFKPKQTQVSRLRSTVAVGGTIYRISDLRTNSDIEDIRTQIMVMRSLARDSQISTALSYYATDATTPNTAGDIIWATALEPKYQQVADLVNDCFKRWKVNNYVGDHILELATIGQFYMPTTEMYRGPGVQQRRELMSLDDNTLVNLDYDIIPSYMIPPEDIIHLWYRGNPEGYVYQPTDADTGIFSRTEAVSYPESSIIHFSLGGLLGKYHISAIDSNGETKDYDIQFADPLMANAVQPTQTLSLLEDALLLSSLTRAVKFVNVECGDLGDEEEIGICLQKIKDKIEQQLALNTATGDAQSFVNPQSPNNLIYLARVNGQDAISITDMNMAETTDSDNKLLDYYQNKKLSVLGVPKEAMNFSSAEGLGGAGAVMSQRSALYANRLTRLETAYKNGWRDALNKYFLSRNMSGFVDKFVLNMSPIITNMDQVLFEKRDATIGQAQNIVNVMRDLGIENADDYKQAITEILTQAFPQTGSAVNTWDMRVKAGGGESGGF